MFIFSLLVRTLKNSKEGKMHDAAFGSFSFVFLASGKGNKANLWWKIRGNAHWNCVPHMINEILLILTAIPPAEAGSVKQWKKKPSHFLLSPTPAPWLPPLNLCLLIKKISGGKQSSHPPFLSPSLESWSSLGQAKSRYILVKYLCLLLARVMVADIRWDGGGGESGGWYAPEEGWDGQAVRCLYSIAWWVCVSPEKREVMNR